MERKDFLKLMSMAPMSLSAMNMPEFSRLTDTRRPCRSGVQGPETTTPDHERGRARAGGAPGLHGVGI